MRHIRGIVVSLQWADLFAGLAFFLILEGMLPLVYPEVYRRHLKKIADSDSGALRLTGAVCMLVGAVLLFIIR